MGKSQQSSCARSVSVCVCVGVCPNGGLSIFDYEEGGVDSGKFDEDNGRFSRTIEQN